MNVFEESEEPLMTLKHMLPKEHGTWAMLLAPWIVGCGVARRFDHAALLSLAAILMFFLAQNQMMNWMRLHFANQPDSNALRRTELLLLVFGLIGILIVSPLWVVDKLHGLIYFALLALLLTAAALFLVQKKKDRSIAGQILAAAGLSLSAPLAYYSTSRTLDHNAGILWLVNFLFFLGGVFYVQMKIDALARRKSFQRLSDRFRFAAGTLVMDSLLVLVAFGSLRWSSFSGWATLAFAPTAIQAIAGTIRLDHPAVLKRVGIISTIHSILFVALFIILA
ncbi:MAG: YwiC-like family protein [Acidobacteriia bacterium]|nr:YwiC-like family protein [Terriglobia bacterium]